jgi:hypothetical protein
MKGDNAMNKKFEAVVPLLEQRLSVYTENFPANTSPSLDFLALVIALALVELAGKK